MPSRTAHALPYHASLWRQSCGTQELDAMVSGRALPQKDFQQLPPPGPKPTRDHRSKSTSPVGGRDFRLDGIRTVIPEKALNRWNPLDRIGSVDREGDEIN